MHCRDKKRFKHLQVFIDKWQHSIERIFFSFFPFNSYFWLLFFQKKEPNYSYPWLWTRSMLANRGDCCCYSTTKIRIWCLAGRPWILSRRLCRWRLWWCSVVDNRPQGCSPNGTKNLPGSSFLVSRSRGLPNTWPGNMDLSTTIFIRNHNFDRWKKIR